MERETGSEKHKGASLEAQGDTDRHGQTVVRCDWSEQRLVSFKSAAKIEHKAVDHQTPLRAVSGPGMDFATCLEGRWACMEHLPLGILTVLLQCFLITPG